MPPKFPNLCPSDKTDKTITPDVDTKILFVSWHSWVGKNDNNLFSLNAFPIGEILIKPPW